MKALISKSEISGTVRVPSSKSYTLRGVMCAALARGDSELVYPLTSDDTEAAINVLKKLGTKVVRQNDVWQVKGGAFRQAEGELFCGESATTLRFMTAICALVPGQSVLTAGPSLSRRPVKPLVDSLQQLGVKCSCNGDFAPVVVEGGKLKGGRTELPGHISSQFVSGLLLIASFAEDGVRIRLTTPLESRPYVLMTIESLEKFGIHIDYSPALDEFGIARQYYRPTRYTVEGDWSSASYLLALGALGGQVTANNLNINSLQGDKMMLEFLRQMGAMVQVDGNSVMVSKGKLRAICADLSDCIDLLPTVAILAAAAGGVSELNGIARGRLKESNRVAAVREGLERMGIKVMEEEDRLAITGGTPKGALIDSKNDHRIAMAFSVLGSIAGATTIQNAECVSKTFPEYWQVLGDLGGRVVIDDK